MNHPKPCDDNESLGHLSLEELADGVRRHDGSEEEEMRISDTYFVEILERGISGIGDAILLGVRLLCQEGLIFVDRLDVEQRFWSEADLDHLRGALGLFWSEKWYEDERCRLHYISQTISGPNVENEKIQPVFEICEQYVSSLVGRIVEPDNLLPFYTAFEQLADSDPDITERYIRFLFNVYKTTFVTDESGIDEVIVEKFTRFARNQETRNMMERILNVGQYPELGDLLQFNQPKPIRISTTSGEFTAWQQEEFERVVKSALTFLREWQRNRDTHVAFGQPIVEESDTCRRAVAMLMQLAEANLYGVKRALMAPLSMSRKLTEPAVWDVLMAVQRNLPDLPSDFPRNELQSEEREQLMHCEALLRRVSDEIEQRYEDSLRESGIQKRDLPHPGQDLHRKELGETLRSLLTENPTGFRIAIRNIKQGQYRHILPADITDVDQQVIRILNKWRNTTRKKDED